MTAFGQYLKANRGAALRIAREIEQPPQVVYAWGSGKRPIPERRCVQIEALTSRQVMRWDLRPHDWHLIWPELVALAGAPTLPSAAAAAAA